MKYYSYKELLESSINSYIYNLEKDMSDPISHVYINSISLLTRLYTILYLVIREDDISQANFELIISNYPELTEYLPSNIRKLL